MTDRSGTRSGADGNFTPEERAAMRERMKEIKAGQRREDGEAAVREKLAGMKQEDRVLGERVHEIVKRVAPQLEPRLWYGMPAYTLNGNVVCYFKDAAKFKTRYATLGFSDEAHLDEGAMWPTEYAITTLTAETEKRIAALVRKAVG